MAKLRKELSGVEKEKGKVVTGKITKFKKLAEVPQPRKVQVKLNSPARVQQRNLENSNSATPFSTNSTLKFTSTPLTVEGSLSNRRLSLRKLPSRLALSPISTNIWNTKEGDVNTWQKREKNDLQKSAIKVSKVNNENLDPDIRIATRSKSVGVRRIAPGSENVRTIENKKNTKSLSSPSRVRVRKLDSSAESLSSDSQSSKSSSKNTLEKNTNKRKNEPGRSCVFSDSSAEVRRIAPALENAKTFGNKENTESESSRVRYGLRKLNTSAESLSSDSQSSKSSSKNTLGKQTNNRKNKPARSCVFSDSSAEVRRIAPAFENAKKFVNKENTESQSSRVRYGLRKLNSSAESLSSDSQSSKSSSKNTLGKQTNNRKNKPARSCVFSDSSAEARRIAPAFENAKTFVNKENTKSRSSQLRVRLCELDSSAESLSSDSQSSKTSNTKNESARSSVRYDLRNVHRQAADKLQSNSGKNHTMVRRLRSDWSSTTLGEESPAPSVVQKLHTTSKSTALPDAKQQYRQNNCSKLRVCLRRSTFDCSSPSIDVNPKRRKSCNDSLLVNRLESDWTSTTFQDTPAQNRTPKDNQLQRKHVNKRRLTPLVEMSVEDTIKSTDTLAATPKVTSRTKSNTNEEVYSSSAEFQSDDEGNHQSRSKRAPTWKDLLNKTSESSVLSKSPIAVVKLNKPHKLNSKTRTDPALSPDKELKKSQQKDKHQTSGDNCRDVKSVIGVKKAPSVNKTSKGPPTDKKKQDNVGVSKDVPFKESHEIGIQNQDSAQDVSICGKTIDSTSPQHNRKQKPDFVKNTNSPPPPHDETAIEIIDLRCPVKFFHSRSENTVTEAKPTENLKRRRSSRRNKQESIYDFLSQSSSESNNPVDDVIQKMIKTGKVVVAKHKKGTGMNTIPRRRVERTLKKKTTKTQEIPIKQTKPAKAAKPPIPENKQHDFDDNLHFDDGFHFDDGENEIPEEEQIRDQRGFSNLARSAMIKQAGRIQKPLQRKPITDKKKLLEMAIKFVNQSTPVRMTPKPLSSPQLSPMAGNKSPWRVDDDKLPNLFYLGRNSDNLPSFSSDFIPMTPSKNKSKSMSSFSSNDSNGENKAPPGANILTNEANMQALTNTRKALTYRSPLKTINIIEVVNLPPLALHSYGKKSNVENTSKNNLQETNHRSTPKIAARISNNNFNNNSNHNSNHSKSDISNENAENQLENTQNSNSRKSNSDISNNNLTNLFGFEELIDDENNFSNITVDKTILPNKDALKERLQRLKQLRPNKPVVIPNTAKRIEPVFDKVRPKQKTLKQMLCSTMIDNNQHHRDAANHSFNEIEDLSNLFKDPEPETTFDDSHPRRTYNRPFKRKRKLLSDYAINMDSDPSEDEEEAIAPVKKYKAKPKKRQKNDPELNKFVNDFNEMCKKVGQYELVVE